LRISPVRSAPDTSSNHPRPGASLILLGLALLVAFTLGFLVHQHGWHESLWRWGREPRATFAAWRARAALPLIAVDLRFSHYQRIVSLRDRALRLGVHVPFVDEAVPATMIFGAGARESVELRLPGGPATPLQGDVWPMELRRTGASAWLRLTPLDETRTEAALLQWGYLEALRREGFAAATQTPVRLEINGSPWGLYVLETPTAVDVALRFEAQAAWEAQAAGEPAGDGGFRYATVTVEGASPVVEGASPVVEAVAHFRDAGQILDACDAEDLGRFLALTVLWTGQPAPDWRTLRWAYDPATQRLTPVGAGQFWADAAPLPEILLDDPAMQIAHARALTEVSRPAYLERLRSEMGSSLEQQWRILGTFATPWARLEAHQQTIRARLSPVQALAVTLEPDGVLYMTNLQPFPLQIVGLDAGGAGLRPLDPAWTLPEDRECLLESGDAFVLRATFGPASQSVRVSLPKNLIAASGDGLAIVCRLWDVNGPELRVPAIDFEAAP